MKIRLFVFLQHGRHETIDISPVVSPRIASASACYRSALFEICDLRGERRLEIHKGGLRAKPTPSGVPVEITSPATSRAGTSTSARTAPSKCLPTTPST
jgi:hypothetical protein